jgi:transcriptional regulator with XRE-family HTH domain
MAKKPLSNEAGNARALRSALGMILQDLRRARRLRQLDIAAAIDLPYYTEISAWEHGVCAFPAKYLVAYARALKVNRKWLALRYLRFTSPYAYRLLYCPVLTIDTVFDASIELPHRMLDPATWPEGLPH